MAYYIHRESFIADPIKPNAIIKFPTLVSKSLNRSAFRNIPPYNYMSETEWLSTVVEDIYYHGCDLPSTAATDIKCIDYTQSAFDGAFDINLPGIYLLSWYVSHFTALSSKGSFFKIKIYNYQKNVWESPNAGKLLLVSSSEFFTVINIKEDYFKSGEGKVTIALFNDSDTTMFANQTPHVKAGFVIFGFNAITDEQLVLIKDRIDELTEGCCGMEIKEENVIIKDNSYILKCLKIQLDKLVGIEKNQNEQINHLEIEWEEFYKRFSKHAMIEEGLAKTYFDPLPINSANTDNGIGLMIHWRRVGYIFEVWLTGTMPAGSSTFPTKIRNGTVCITPAEELPFLNYFNQETPTITTLTKVTNKSTINPVSLRYPITINKSGIFVNFGTNLVTLNSDFFGFNINLVLEKRGV